MKFNPYCKNLTSKVFDIETTGLYPREDRIISASFINTDGTDLVQYFLETPDKEDILVEQIVNELSKCNIVITYNGNMFDIPFVLTRAKKLRVCETLPMFWSIDIYRLLKTYWPQAKRMENLKQKSVEFALGLEENRVDEIGGGECIELYNRYVDWNEEDAKNLILLHNGDDVRQLARITEKLNFLPFHQIAFEKGFLVENILLCESKLLKTKLSIKAKTHPGMLETDIYNDNYHLTYSSFTGDILLDIFVTRKDSLCFVDLNKLFTQHNKLFESENCKNGYLILKNKEINYKDCNMLASEILTTVLTK